MVVELQQLFVFEFFLQFFHLRVVVVLHQQFFIVKFIFLRVVVV